MQVFNRSREEDKRGRGSAWSRGADGYRKPHGYRDDDQYDTTYDWSRDLPEDEWCSYSNDD